MSRQQTKFKADDLINYDELLESSSMSGLVSFLTEIPCGTSGIPKKDHTTSHQSTSGIPNDPIHTTGMPATGIPTDYAAPLDIPPLGIPKEPFSVVDVVGQEPVESNVRTGVPTKPLRSIGIPIEFSNLDESSHDCMGVSENGDASLVIPIGLIDHHGLVPSRSAQLIATRHLRPARTRIVQDGHSPNEQSVYEALWNAGQNITGKSSKTVQIGYGDLARRARVSRNSVIRLLASLEKKMAVRTEGNTSQQGTCYTVYDFRTILESREKAGLFFAVRDRNAVHLLTEQEVLEAHRLSLGIPIEPSSGIPSLGTNTLGMQRVGIPSTPTKGIPGIPKDPHLPHKTRNIRESTTTTVREILQSHLPTFDDDAAEQLWAECRQQVPDVTADEIAILFLRKLPDSQMRGITNPNGFLLRAVARSCTVAAIAALRQGRELPRDIPIIISSNELEEALRDPNTPPQVRLREGKE